MSTKKEFVEGSPVPVTPNTTEQKVQDHTPGQKLASPDQDYDEDEHSADVAPTKDHPDQDKHPIREGQPSRAAVHAGSATQGGSNFGQGSSSLGKKELHQGESKGDGSNYDNESGWNNEALRTEDIEGNQ